MGQVIPVVFGMEREWQKTLEQTTAGLVGVGALFGDGERLMRAKAERIHKLMREIVEDVPVVQVTTRLPAGLTAEQLEQVTEAVRAATLKGIEVTMTHAVCKLMESTFDLCTSKLAEGK